jgi:equilibrative nucleoside transporter 1/2/3
VAGVAVAASSILSALAGKTAGDTNRSAFLYFLSALLVTVAALVGRLILSQQPFYTHQMQQGKPVDENETDGMTTTPLSQIIRKSSGLIFAVGYIFVITLMLFPTITSLIKSVRLHPPSFLSPGRFFDDDIFIATHFMLFNVGDWLGRIIPLWPFFRTFNPRLLALYSVARTAFIPLFLVCNIVVSTERHLPVLITSDVVYFVLVLVFSVTNGWISCVAMMAAPQQPFLQNGTDQSRAGNVMGFSLVAGLAIGGCLSFWARSLV